MNSKANAKRTKMRLYRAKLAVVRDGVSLRQAAARFHLPKSTIHDYVTRKACAKKIGTNRALSDDEEQTVLESLLYFADLGVPLTRSDVREAIAMLVSTFSEERKQSLPFRDGKPGRAYLRNFESGIVNRSR